MTDSLLKELTSNGTLNKGGIINETNIDQSHIRKIADAIFNMAEEEVFESSRESRKSVSGDEIKQEAMDLMQRLQDRIMDIVDDKIRKEYSK